MAKLNRLTAKIFGETASTTNTPKEIGQFGSAKAGTYNATGDVATIQSLPAWSNGWIDAVTPTDQFPPLPEMTGVHKVLSYQNAYLLQQGIPEWDSATTYYTNNFCSKAGKIYISQSDANLNNDPETDTVNWKVFESGGARNIGEIVASTIPLTDAGLHLLDGALISGSGIYSAFVDYMANIYDTAQKYSNVNIIGSLTDTDGVLSGFGNSNYARVSQQIPLATANNFDFVFKFTYNTSSATQSIFAENNVAYFSQISILTSGKLYCALSNNHTSANIGTGTGTTTLTSGSTYFVKFSFTGTAYNVYLSSTGAFNGEETTEITISSSSKLLTYTWNIGCSALSAYPQSFSQGSIDLNESYININGSRWWTGMQPSWATDEAQWQTSATNYGVCGKFVYDSVNNTVRLPKVTGIIEGTTDATALGDLVEAGLPNITGNVSFKGQTSGGSGAANGAFAYTVWGDAGSADSAGAYYSANFDASRSSSIYGNSSTVQPQTIKVLYYIVIATSTKTDIQVDIDEIATDLNGKMDVDMSNMNASQLAKNTIVGWGIPDYTAGVSLSSPSTYQTLPCDCYVCYSADTGSGVASAGFYYANPDGAYEGSFRQALTYSRKELGLFLPKGWKVKSWNSDSTLTYYPLKGVS